MMIAIGIVYNTPDLNIVYIHQVIRHVQDRLNPRVYALIFMTV